MVGALRREQLCAVSALLLSCTQLLDLDHDYVETQSAASSSVASSSSSQGGAGGNLVGGGGASPDGMIEVGAFSIAALEVSRAEYQAFLAAEADLKVGAGCGQNQDATPTITWPPGAAAEALPVSGVDWCDAAAYCAWRGVRLCGAIGGGPLPPDDAADATASAWFFACSQSGQSTYPYGDDYAAGLCVGDGFDGTEGYDMMTDVVRAATGPPTCGGEAEPFSGVINLSGNVAEWEDACQGGSCLVRGGSFRDGARGLRCDATKELGKLASDEAVGIRCCAP